MMPVFIHSTEVVAPKLADIAEKLPYNKEVIYCIEQAVIPVLSKQDQKKIMDFKNCAKDKTKESIKDHLIWGITISVSGCGLVLVSLLEKDISIDYKIGMFICGMLAVATGIGIALYARKYTNDDYCQEIYKKYPQAQEIMKDAEKASDLLKKLADPKNYTK
ncbi:MAG: hypothetical protein LBJ73_03375 [Rickettsiales bacterium]|jgi:hypothetical protein|nr:hypothetical protein [Rickettsiales bacterium]